MAGVMGRYPSLNGSGKPKVILILPVPIPNRIRRNIDYDRQLVAIRVFIYPPGNPKRKLREGELLLSLYRRQAVQWEVWSTVSKPMPFTIRATT